MISCKLKKNDGYTGSCVSVILLRRKDNPAPDPVGLLLPQERLPMG